MFKVENMKPRDKWYSLYDKIFAEDNLKEAFRKVKKNKGAGGIDKITIENYENSLDRNIQELQRMLRQKTYQPLPVRRVDIPKPNGKSRPLGIPTIRDRVTQQAVTNILEPIFEPIFHNASFGFRPDRSPHKAIAQIEQYLKDGYQWVVDADIEDFFGTLDHELLLTDLNTKIADGSVLRLIRSFLYAGVLQNGRKVHDTKGTPQGGVISPLLSNIYLNSFDWLLASYGFKLVRYCDDWIILCKSQVEADHALAIAESFLNKRNLVLNRDKTRVVHHSQGFEFLGFWFKDYYGIHRKGPRKRAVDSFKNKVRFVTRRNQPKNIKMLVERLNPIIRGWGLYFGIGDTKSSFKRLDEWTRMRLRSFIAKKHSLSQQAHSKYRNQYFNDLGFCFLSDLIIPSSPTMGNAIGEPYTGNPYVRFDEGTGGSQLKLL
jgi:RNA-directed DNA polymerase